MKFYQNPDTYLHGVTIFINIYHSRYNRYQQLHANVKSVISNLQIIQKIWYN
jgi:hypothetical protein